MMSNGELPLLKESKLGLLDILQSIEKHHMGFTILTDEHGKMTGISSNADVRRGLIANCADLNKTPIESIINRSPIAIHEHKTINELLEFVKSLKFPILYLPVVDSQMRVTGAIKFNNLIKGES